MKIDMSPEAITNRLKTMDQLWELSISLLKAKPLENNKEENSESIRIITARTATKAERNDYE
ncbi:MAG: hypothetical protein ACR2F2_09980, partial [Pyrinomonadaceae bacterium]